MINNFSSDSVSVNDRFEDAETGEEVSDEVANESNLKGQLNETNLIELENNLSSTNSIEVVSETEAKDSNLKEQLNESDLMELEAKLSATKSCHSEHQEQMGTPTTKTEEATA